MTLPPAERLGEGIPLAERLGGGESREGKLLMSDCLPNKAFDDYTGDWKSQQRTAQCLPAPGNSSRRRPTSCLSLLRFLTAGSGRLSDYYDYQTTRLFDYPTND